MRDLVDDVGEERLALYRTFKGVVGLDDPITPKNQEKQIKGILRHIFGAAPKYSFVHRKVLSTPTDLVGRAVISPDPELDIDHVGLPEDKAWAVYSPFVIRSLVRRGVAPVQAALAVKDRQPIARQALLSEMERRPVYITRAPTLHRYGVMAFWPKLVTGETMRLAPLITKGFNADFDGDQMNYHVAVTDKGVRDAIEKMLPSRNLLSIRDFKPHMLPTNEFLAGLFAATAQSDKKNPERVFANKEAAIEAYRQGKIRADTRVAILQ
jgi:DNA-directed RNA polymerase subunit beta'